MTDPDTVRIDIGLESDLSAVALAVDFHEVSRTYSCTSIIPLLPGDLQLMTSKMICTAKAIELRCNR
jgi:hypothetical protein